MVMLRSNTQKEKQLQPHSIAQACPTTVGEMSVPTPPLRHNQQQVPSQSVQAPDANSFSLNDMFKEVATIFQQIMTQRNGAMSEGDRIMATTTIVLKLMKQMAARVHRR
jgi:hypothetical protein